MGCWLPGPREDPATGANCSVLPSPHWTAEAQGCRWTREATTSLNPQLSFLLFLVLVPSPHAKPDWLSSGEMPMSWLLGSRGASAWPLHAHGGKWRLAVRAFVEVETGQPKPNNHPLHDCTDNGKSPKGFFFNLLWQST